LSIISYSLTQAEYFVKFSKEAKNYQKTKEKEKISKTYEYIKELYRVFLQNDNPDSSEVDTYVNDLLTGFLRHL
jgi:hypothetical protein